MKTKEEHYKSIQEKTNMEVMKFATLTSILDVCLDIRDILANQKKQ